MNDPVIVSKLTLQTLLSAARFQKREVDKRRDPADPYRDLLTCECLDFAIEESEKALRIKADL